ADCPVVVLELIGAQLKAAGGPQLHEIQWIGTRHSRCSAEGRIDGRSVRWGRWQAPIRDCCADFVVVREHELSQRAVGVVGQWTFAVRTGDDLERCPAPMYGRDAYDRSREPFEKRWPATPVRVSAQPTEHLAILDDPVTQVVEPTRARVTVEDSLSRGRERASVQIASF